MAMRQFKCWQDIEAETLIRGFLPFFANEVPGYSIEEHTPAKYWFSGLPGPWEWKGDVIRHGKCVYGKFFRRKAGYISLNLFKEYANWRRDGYDLDARYEDGLAPREDLAVWQLLAEKPSVLSKELKKAGGFGKNGKKGFDTILTRLQMQGYVVIADFQYLLDKRGEPYGWGVARYATPEQLYGAAFTDEVYRHTPEESRQLVLQTLTRNMTEAQAVRLLGKI